MFAPFESLIDLTNEYFLFKNSKKTLTAAFKLTSAPCSTYNSYWFGFFFSIQFVQHNKLHLKFREITNNLIISKDPFELALWSGLCYTKNKNKSSNQRCLVCYFSFLTPCFWNGSKWKNQYICYKKIFSSLHCLNSHWPLLRWGIAQCWYFQPRKHFLTRSDCRNIESYEMKNFVFFFLFLPTLIFFKKFANSQSVR